MLAVASVGQNTNVESSPAENAAVLQFSAYGDHIKATTVLTFFCYRSVPTKDSILVPETLLKKRKSQEKEREARAADLKKKREVSNTVFRTRLIDVVMIITHMRLGFRASAVVLLTIFRD